MSLSERIATHLADLITEVRTQTLELKASLSTSQAARPLRGDRPIQAGAGGLRILWGGPGRLTGYNLVNPCGEPTLVRLLDSRDATGDPIAVIPLAPGGSIIVAHSHNGISFGEGLFLDSGCPDVYGVVTIGREQ